MMFAMCPIPLIGRPFPAIASGDIGLVDLRYADYAPATGQAGAGSGFALRPVLSNVVACENPVTRAAEGVSNITCR
jgi:hypothetical protein